MDHVYMLEASKTCIKCQKAWNVPHVSLKVLSQSGSRGRELIEDQARAGRRGGRTTRPRRPRQTAFQSLQRPQPDKASSGGRLPGTEGTLNKPDVEGRIPSQVDF